MANKTIKYASEPSFTIIIILYPLALRVYRGYRGMQRFLRISPRNKKLNACCHWVARLNVTVWRKCFWFYRSSAATLQIITAQRSLHHRQHHITQRIYSCDGQWYAYFSSGWRMYRRSKRFISFPTKYQELVFLRWRSFALHRKSTPGFGR